MVSTVRTDQTGPLWLASRAMSLTLSYRSILAVLAVAGFFTGLLNYLFTEGLSPIQPASWILVLLFLALPRVFEQRALTTVLTSPVLWWCGVYAAMTSVWFMWSSQSAIAVSEVRSRLLSVTFLVTMVLLFADPRVHGVSRVALLWSVFLGVALNVVDIVRPLTFSPLVGRAAGFYVNPNGSAISLVLAMVVSVERIRPWFRPWFACLAGAGVLLTFSRGGMAAWVLATVLFIALGGMRLLPFLRVLVATMLFAAGALYFSGRLQATAQILSSVSSDAWTQLRVGEGLGEFSAEYRLQDAARAWKMFLDEPLTGHGVGATGEWDSFESTHDIYLRDLAEYGIAGLFIAPLLVLMLWWRRGVPRPRVAIILGAVGLLWGVFSHNILDERQFLMCVALVASISEAYRRGIYSAAGLNSRDESVGPLPLACG